MRMGFIIVDMLDDFVTGVLKCERAATNLKSSMLKS